MKLDKPIKMGWDELINPLPRRKDIEGYSTVEDISKKKKMSRYVVKRTLDKLRESGRIDAIEVRSANGQTCWVYKD